MSANNYRFTHSLGNLGKLRQQQSQQQKDTDVNVKSIPSSAWHSENGANEVSTPTSVMNEMIERRESR